MSVLTAPVTHQVLDLQKTESPSSATPVPQSGTQKIFGSTPCPNRDLQSPWLLANPSWLTAWAVKTRITLSRSSGAVDQSGLVVLDQPQTLVPPLQPKSFIQIASLVERALDPSSGSILPSKAYGPKHYEPRPHWSSASYDCNKLAALDNTAEPTPMPLHKPTPNIYCHS